jgi:hypothetical protein
LKDTQIVVVPQKKKVEEKKEESKGGRPKKGKATAATDDKPAEEEKKDEPAVPEKVFSEADAIAAIESVHSFEESSLDFFNFLDCIVRISRVYPYT